MRQFYPAIRPYASHRVDVAGGHALYVEECGIPEGIPVLFVHGGPGAGCSEQDRRFFDPEKYHIILFDQRGAGRSRPHADLNDNTTAHLLADMETLREKLGVERWLLFGGSWGSTLALAYGLSHPDRTAGFILRGIFLGARPEIDWFLHGMRTIFPEAWRDFTEHLPEGERSDLLGNYYRRLIDRNPDIHRPAARA
ncbi:MAG: alpha/beta fold hydrolase, partial [Gammaproteobacteria bacterium]|nr:alpha/beta fold hydrolase [Gammaproteobacteria bacterium]